MTVKFIDTPFLIAICVTIDPEGPFDVNDGWMISKRNMVLTSDLKDYLS